MVMPPVTMVDVATDHSAADTADDRAHRAADHRAADAADDGPAERIGLSAARAAYEQQCAAAIIRRISNSLMS